MRPTCMLFIASAILLLPSAGFAEDYRDCKLTCAAEKESRNTRCPSPHDSSAARQCMNENEDAYEDCVNRCPTPSAPPASDEKTSPRSHFGLSMAASRCRTDRSFI